MVVELRGNYFTERESCFMVAHCPICNSDELIDGIKYNNLYWPTFNEFNNLEILYCESCGFGFSWPELNDERVTQFYKNNYREKTSPFYINFNRLKLPIGFDSRSLGQILLAKQFIQFEKDDIFLDLGPGSGSSFAIANMVFKKPRCLAVELCSGASEAYKRIYGIKTYSSLSDIISCGIKAKMCMLSHSLEHFKLSWLRNAIVEMKEVLVEDGVLVIEVPLVDMRKHALFRIADSPHFLFFSNDSIKQLFISTGWNVLFCDSVADRYSDWWKTQSNFDQPNLAAKKNTMLKTTIKNILGVLPLFLSNKIKRCFLDSNLTKVFHEQFSYGGDRTCIRIVVKKMSSEL